MEDAIRLAEFLKSENIHPEQVQDFYPTPGTVSTCMYYTGLDPESLKPIYVPKSKEEKANQRALLQFYRKENHPMIRKTLQNSNRADLIGYHKTALVPPERFASTNVRSDQKTVSKRKKTSLTKHLKKKKK